MVAIGAVIFDFGGVLRAGSPAAGKDSPFARVERERGLPGGALFRALYLENQAWLDLRVGKGTLEEWRRSVEATLAGLAGSKVARAIVKEIDELRSPGDRSRRGAPEFNPGMLELVADLRGRYRLGILSNATPGLEEELAGYYGIAHLFDDIVNSATVGLAKPDPRVYRLAAERLDMSLEGCFFTDDLAPNVEAARAEGMTAHLFRGVSGLREALRAAGVALPSSPPPRDGG